MKRRKLIEELDIDGKNKGEKVCTGKKSSDSSYGSIKTLLNSEVTLRTL
jgi:hypothetical protein